MYNTSVPYVSDVTKHSSTETLQVMHAVMVGFMNTQAKFVKRVHNNPYLHQLIDVIGCKRMQILSDWMLHTINRRDNDKNFNCIYFFNKVLTMLTMAKQKGVDFQKYENFRLLETSYVYGLDLCLLSEPLMVTMLTKLTDVSLKVADSEFVYDLLYEVLNTSHIFGKGCDHQKSCFRRIVNDSLELPHANSPTYDTLQVSKLP
ncbi:hypothetical protein TetV_512 [Tetraselmis virus 1]|uniref:Uncharacterized protein n=1 Tax=Tetraselmis virus 1 TaxID=2060617 RepID=A0A2P0VNW2_9VIRU|nr:hypothetical protein QJ968_gp542 [Tetraselmis virus 1]AUF82594.1 hypothetical protein TetV_512 [Tetraselmis virus 1]